MFIERLWKKNPDGVTQKVKEICRINEEIGDRFGFRGISENGELEFVKFGLSSFTVKVSDYNIELAFNSSYANMPSLSLEWMKYMKGVFGDKYLYHYIAYRNKEIDKYNIAFAKQTNKVLKELGFDVTNGVIK